MKDLTNLQNQIDLVQQVVLCYENFKMNPLDTVKYIQNMELLPKIPSLQEDVDNLYQNLNHHK